MRQKLNATPHKLIKRVRHDAIPEQAVLTVPQAAKIAGLTEHAAWLAIYRKRFPHRRIGRKVIVLRSDLDLFLNALPGLTAEAAQANLDAE